MPNDIEIPVRKCSLLFARMEELAKLEEIYSMGFIFEEEYKRRLSQILETHPELEQSKEALVEAGEPEEEEKSELEADSVDVLPADSSSSGDVASMILNSFKNAEWLDSSVTEDDIVEFLQNMEELPVSALFNTKLVNNPPIHPSYEPTSHEYSPGNHTGLSRNHVQKLAARSPLAKSSVEYFNSLNTHDESSEIVVPPMLVLDTETRQIQKQSAGEIIEGLTEEAHQRADAFLSNSSIQEYEELCLNNFPLLSEVPHRLFSHPWTQLYHLEIRHCSLREVPERISQLTRLVSLDLSFNYISEVSGKFDGLNNLEILDLAYNQITDTGNIEQLPKLKVLNLTGNLIQHSNGENNREHSYPILANPCTLPQKEKLRPLPSGASIPRFSRPQSFAESNDYSYMVGPSYSGCSRFMVKKQKQLVDEVRASKYFEEKANSTRVPYNCFNPIPWTYLIPPMSG